MDIKEVIKSDILLNQKDIRLDTFLSKALYDKYGYYYKKNPIGKNNDFVTAPEISQMFGEVIGLYLYYIWHTKINSKFNFIELGPGKGTLFIDIANSISKYPNFFKLAKIFFIEINEELIKIQQKKFQKYNYLNISWKNIINFKSKIPSIIYSNEFFDCFPIRQFLFKNCWLEKYVSYNKYSDKFYLKDKKVVNKNILSSLQLYEEEKYLEISFERNRYFDKICKFIKKNGGVFFTIDYGYFKSKNYSTLQAIQNHKYSHVLENIGEKDISSHVNFGDLLDIAKKNKLNVDEYCSQNEFLVKYGILERGKELSKFNNELEIENELERLIGKKQMGDLFKCIVVSNL